MNFKLIFRDVYWDDEMWDSRLYEFVEKGEVFLPEIREPGMWCLSRKGRCVFVYATGNSFPVQGKHPFIVGFGLEVKEGVKISNL